MSCPPNDLCADASVPGRDGGRTFGCASARDSIAHYVSDGAMLWPSVGSASGSQIARDPRVRLWLIERPHKGILAFWLLLFTGAEALARAVARVVAVRLPPEGSRGETQGSCPSCPSVGRLGALRFHRLANKCVCPPSDRPLQRLCLQRCVGGARRPTSMFTSECEPGLGSERGLGPMPSAARADTSCYQDGSAGEGQCVALRARAPEAKRRPASLLHRAASAGNQARCSPPNAVGRMSVALARRRVPKIGTRPLVESSGPDPATSGTRQPLFHGTPMGRSPTRHVRRPRPRPPSGMARNGPNKEEWRRLEELVHLPVHARRHRCDAPPVGRFMIGLMRP